MNVPIATTVVGLIVLAGQVGAQIPNRPSLLVAPWGGPPNMAAEVATQILADIDSLGRFDRVDWADLVNSSEATRDMPESRRAELGCIQGRQLAAVEDIEYVMCGALIPTPDGIRLQMEAWEIEAGSRIAFSPFVATDQKSLVEHALAEIRGWQP